MTSTPFRDRAALEAKIEALTKQVDMLNAMLLVSNGLRIRERGMTPMRTPATSHYHASPAGA